MKKRANQIKQLIPGLLLVLVIALISKGLNGAIEHIVKLEALTLGILIGFIYNNTVGIAPMFSAGVKFSLKKLLKVGIVLLGFKLSIHSLIEVGPKLTLVVLCFVPTVLFVATMLGRLFKIDKKIATLIGVGSSICGASAVVALAPCIEADDDDAVIAVSIVNFLGAIGVLVYSFVALVSPISNQAYGAWSGLSLHGVAHALAAAFARGSVAGDLGTLVKMERVLMLVPVALCLGFIFRKTNGSGQRRSVSFPMYILYFVLAAIINSLGILPAVIVNRLIKISSYCILMAMVGMGLSVDLQSIKDKGASALLVGTMLFIFTSTTTYFLVQSVL